MTDTTRGYLEVRDGRGDVARVPLRSGVMTVGRAADAAVRLDSPAVSRRHAELVSDPYGRWMVRDLGSRNGTIYRGVPVAKEQVLAAGDAFEIEDFRLTLRLPTFAGGPPGAKPRDPEASGLTLMESGSSVRQLRDLEPPQLAAAHLKALHELGARMLAIADDRERLSALCRLMISPDFNGHTAVVLRLRRDAPDAAPEVIHGPESSRSWRSGETPQLSRTILREVLRTQTAVVAGNAGSTGVIEMSMAAQGLGLAAIACPLRNDGDTLDVLYVTFPPEYAINEWLQLAALATEQYQQAELQWASRRQSEAQALITQELDHARKIQERLVPRRISIPGLDLAMVYEPCLWVAGDFVGVNAMPDGRVLLVVADVCGKGLQAALISSGVHAAVYSNTRSAASLTDLMQRLDGYLCSMLPDDSFVTAVGVLLDPRTGELECVNAGHPPPMIVSPASELRQLQAGANPPLGCMGGALEAQPDRLASGDLLALYTDGLNELANEEGVMLGLDGLGGYLRETYRGHAGEPAARLAERFGGMLNAFQGRTMAQDDRTFLFARRG